MEEPWIQISLADPHLSNQSHPLTRSGVTPSTSDDLYGEADLVAGGDVGTIIGISRYSCRAKGRPNA